MKLNLSLNYCVYIFLNCCLCFRRGLEFRPRDPKCRNPKSILKYFYRSNKAMSSPFVSVIIGLGLLQGSDRARYGKGQEGGERWTGTPTVATTCRQVRLHETSAGGARAVFFSSSFTIPAINLLDLTFFIYTMSVWSERP